MRSLLATALALSAVGLGVVSAPAAMAVDAGDLDTSFSGDGRVTFDVFGGVDDDGAAAAIQANGKIVVAGSWEGFASGGSGKAFALARFNPDGSLDTSFGAGGRVLTAFPAGPAAVTAVAIQSNGRIVAAGSRDDDDGVDDGDFALARYTADGSLDTSFSGDGKQIISFGGSEEANAVAIQPDGRIVMAGSHFDSEFLGGDDDFALARFTSSGALDTSFHGDGKLTTGLGDWDNANAIAIQDDGGIVAAGTSGDPSEGEFDFALARYHSNGALDRSFAGDGKLTTGLGGNDRAQAIAIQEDDRILAVGRGGDDGDFALARYNPGGLLDGAFDGDGKLTTDFGSAFDGASGVALQANGRIVAAGRFGTSEFALARYNKSGSLDTSFAGDGRIITDLGRFDFATAVAIQADGKIVAAGTTDEFAFGDAGDLALARYHAVTDNTPPETIIDSGPSGTTTDRTPSFSFHATESGSSFSCSIDGGAFAGCSSPHTTAPLTDGPHTFQVRARDAVGNIDTSPATRIFTVDTTPPADTDPPQTRITSGPNRKTKRRAATFRFVSDEPDSSFRCKLDDRDFRPCTSPKRYERLRFGRHVFRVRATDLAGNADPTPAKWEWRVRR